MKKTLVIIIALMLIAVIPMTFAGCGDSFNTKSVRIQIEENLGWHKGGKEICEYDVFDKNGAKTGKFSSVMESVSQKDVTIATTDESVAPSLKKFTGYKFTSEMTASTGDKQFSRITESYANAYLSPPLSYVKVTDNGKTTEIITKYTGKKTEVTFIVDGKKSQSSDKYKSGSMIYDNAFLYQFARATDLASNLSISVPTYTVGDSVTKTENTNYTVGYSSAGNVILNDYFIVNKKFKDNIASGDVNSGDIESGDISDPITAGGVNDKHNDTEEKEIDESGNVVAIIYDYTKTKSIPVKKCTISTTKTFSIKASVYCYISVNKIRNDLDKDNEMFANRAVVMFEEGDVTYKLTSIRYTP